MSSNHYKKNHNGLYIAAIIALLLAFFFKDKLNEIDFGGGSTCPDGRSETSQEGVCSSINGYEKIGLVFGNTQNTPILKDEISKNELISEAVGDAFYASSEKGVNIKMYSVASPNTTIDTKNKLRGPAKNFNASKNYLKSDLSIINNATKTQPLSDGADYLGAIIQAAKENKSDKTAIVVIGSGLSDKGALNFADNQLIEKYSRGEFYAGDVLSRSGGYDKTLLANTDIIWINIGEYTSPQTEISEPAKAYIKNIYRNTFKYLGANEENIKFENVSHSERSIDTDKTVKITKVGKIGGDFTENVAKFNATTATMTSAEEEKARAWLRENIISKNFSEGLRITGYIDAALDHCPEDSDALPKARAQKIKQMLIDLGYDGDKISTDGYPMHPPKDGSVDKPTCDTPQSPDNRTVRIKMGY